MAKKSKKKKKIEINKIEIIPAKPKKNKTIPIISFFINLFLPGIGTLLVKIKKGIAQLILLIGGLLLITISKILEIKIFLWIGILLILISWIYALVTTIKIILKN